MSDNSSFFPIQGGSGDPTKAPVGGLVIGGLPFAWQRSIVSQYANSPILLNLIAKFAAAMEQKWNLDNFYDLVWNVQTATGWGLDVWGHIVVVSRTLQVATRYFGFEEGAPDYDPFDTSPFYSGAPTTNAYVLSDDVFRLLIIAKAAANIWDGSIAGANAILNILFPNRGVCYLADNGDMTMTYTFQFLPTPVELAIIETSKVLPRPTGVAVKFAVG